MAARHIVDVDAVGVPARAAELRGGVLLAPLHVRQHPCRGRLRARVRGKRGPRALRHRHDPRLVLPKQQRELVRYQLSPLRPGHVGHLGAPRPALDRVALPRLFEPHHGVAVSGEVVLVPHVHRPLVGRHVYHVRELHLPRGAPPALERAHGEEARAGAVRALRLVREALLPPVERGVHLLLHVGEGEEGREVHRAAAGAAVEGGLELAAHEHAQHPPQRHVGPRQHLAGEGERAQHVLVAVGVKRVQHRGKRRGGDYLVAPRHELRPRPRGQGRRGPPRNENAFPARLGMPRRHLGDGAVPPPRRRAHARGADDAPPVPLARAAREALALHGARPARALPGLLEVSQDPGADPPPLATVVALHPAREAASSGALLGAGGLEAVPALARGFSDLLGAHGHPPLALGTLLPPIHGTLGARLV
mmetsp:Transcript_67654/g.214176  ORF Transcript_67654/g.214176 Transcript_67654/m.214176 type:complete len:421 (-) Transcript_67654:7-1269(-)